MYNTDIRGGASNQRRGVVTDRKEETKFVRLGKRDYWTRLTQSRLETLQSKKKKIKRCGTAEEGNLSKGEQKKED